MLLVRIGGRYVHLLKMFGSLFTFGAAFNVLNSAYTLSVTLETAAKANPLAWGDVFGQITAPIGWLFIWLALLVLGLAIYRSDRTILPIEENVKTIKDPKRPSARRAGLGRRRK